MSGTTVHRCRCAVELMYLYRCFCHHIGMYWMCWICDFLIRCLLRLLYIQFIDTVYTCCGTCAISFSSRLDQCAVPCIVDLFRWKVLPGLSHEIFVWHLDLYMYVERLTMSDSHIFAYIKALLGVQIPCQLLCLSACCHLSDEMTKWKDGKVERSKRQTALRSKAWPKHWGNAEGLWPRLTDIRIYRIYPLVI